MASRGRIPNYIIFAEHAEKLINAYDSGEIGEDRICEVLENKRSHCGYFHLMPLLAHRKKHDILFKYIPESDFNEEEKKTLIMAVIEGMHTDEVPSDKFEEDVKTVFKYINMGFPAIPEVMGFLYIGGSSFIEVLNGCLNIDVCAVAAGMLHHFAYFIDNLEHSDMWNERKLDSSAVLTSALQHGGIQSVYVCINCGFKWSYNILEEIAKKYKNEYISDEKGILPITVVEDAILQGALITEDVSSYFVRDRESYEIAKKYNMNITNIALFELFKSKELSSNEVTKIIEDYLKKYNIGCEILIVLSKIPEYRSIVRHLYKKHSNYEGDGKIRCSYGLWEDGYNISMLIGFCPGSR